MKNNKTSNIIGQWLLMITLLSLFTLASQAALPDDLDYQGYLTDSTGSPINSTVSVTFSLYNVGLDGVPLWSNTQSVTVSKGLFSVKLGGAVSPFPLGLFDAPLWLSLNVASDGEMSPRIALSSAAFAHKADDALTLDGISATNLDQSAHVSNTGNPHSVTATQVGAIASASFIAHTGDASAHHARYTNGEATGAMGIAGNTNPLNHNRYANSEAVVAIKAADGAGSTLDADLFDGNDSSAFMSAFADNWVNTTGDTMTGVLNVNADINTSTGYQIGGVTVLKTPGFYNLFVGEGAGQSNTTGYANTFSGYLAGYRNTTGNYNTFSGFRAGYYNTTGNYNTFSGYRAGYANTTGTSNTFSGDQAGRFNTTGNANTFSGTSAGSSNTTGYNNTFSGYQAGLTNTTGIDNTFSGYQAGEFNTGGNSNTFSGFRAGRANTTGYNNTFSGYQAGLTNTTGNSNTFSGFRAGYSNVTGSRNVFLGQTAGYYETGSNRLYIDNSSTASPLIWGDFAANFLDVNGRLHVKRSINAVGTLFNHVAIIENTSIGTSPDVLALKVGLTTAPGNSVNFISFKDGNNASLGAIQGNGAGSVTLAGAGNDYAEYLPRLNKAEVIAPGDIVGVFNGNVSKHTEGAHRAMVVSSNPIISGNDPGDDKREAHSLIAFVGQAEVKVRGAVKAGDYLIPDGKQTGVGLAISADAITAEQFSLVVGQAWEGSTDSNVKKIRALVGLQQANPVITKLVAENLAQTKQLAQQNVESRAMTKELAQLRRENAAQKTGLTQLKAELAGVIQQVVYIQKVQQQQQLYSVRLSNK